MRRGSTLVELAALLGVSGVVIAGGIGVIRPLHRLASADAGAGTRAEQACALLRRDLAAGGARIDGAAVRIARGDGPETVWAVEDGHLLRNGRILLPVVAFAPTTRAGLFSIDITPTDLPARRIEAPQ